MASSSDPAGAEAPMLFEYADFESSIELSHGDYASYFPQNALDEYELYPDFEAADLSPAAENRDKSSENNSETQKSTTKRRRPNRYKNCSPEVLSRRRAQNRTSQRAYRQRKDKRIQELEDLLSSERSKHNVLSHAYAALQAEMGQLEAERQQWVINDQQGISRHSQPIHASMNHYLYNTGMGHMIDPSGTDYMHKMPCRY